MEAIKRVKEWRVGVSIPLPIVCETIALPFELTPQIPSLPQLRRRGGRAGRWPVRTGNARRSATHGVPSQPVRRAKRLSCAHRESNPGHLDGNEVLYH